MVLVLIFYMAVSTQKITYLFLLLFYFLKAFLKYSNNYRCLNIYFFPVWVIVLDVYVAFLRFAKCWLTRRDLLPPL